MQDRTSIPKDEASPVLDSPTPMSVDSPKKRKQLFLLALILVLVIIAGIVGVIAYQNHINQVNQANAHNAYLSALTGSGTQVFSDPLSDGSQSKWTPDSGSAGTCQFQQNAYYITQQSNSFVICNAQVGGNIQNFAFEVQISIIQGGCGGMVFRETNGGNFDYFYICETTRAVDSFDIIRYSDYYITALQLPYGDSSAIHVGLGKPNTLAVRAVGSTMTFFINEQQVAQAQDPDGYMQGGIGLAAYPPGLNNPSEIAYTNARLWTL